MTNSAFLPGTSVQFAWDSVSIGALKKCPKYYEHTIVQGWRSRMDNVHLTFGIIYHGACERYDHAKANGSSHDAAMLIAVRWALNATWDSKMKRPWVSEDKNKNRDTLLRTIIWYLDQFGQNDPIQTLTLANGKPAVELSFRMELDFAPRGAAEPFMLCGHLDRIGVLNDRIKIVDKKSTKHLLDDKYFDQYTPDNQFSGYSFAGRVIYNIPLTGIIVDAAQVAVTFTRFQRREVTRTTEQLDEWYSGLKVTLEQAQDYAKHNFWPLNDKACFGCEFRKICSISPSLRERWLAAGFIKRTWDPLVTRGDV